MSVRIALAALVLLLAGAGAATFAPSSASGASCGTWVAPEWSASETAELVGKYDALSERASVLSPEMSGEAAGRAERLMAIQQGCDAALGTRRMVALVLLGLAVAVPAAVLFVGSGAGRVRERSEP